jgi:Asp-tRNA(Asn)/Glu-tRNA(Gln) amidotransferase C subunit
MIKKKQYLELLNNILDAEDDVTEHFYKYTSDSLKYYKWLREDQKEQITEITTKLRDDCHKHKNTIEELIKHVQESEKDVF